MSSLNWILEERVVAILRGVRPGDMNKIVDALYEGGIRVLEITLNSDNALPLIATLSKQFEGRMLIGAGTVLDLNDAKAAHKAGARFLISPGFDTDVVGYTKKNALVSIPGAFTATEIMNAHKAGADIVKIFPVSDASYIKNVSAPLNKIRMMPTGGITTSNIHEFANAGAVAFGIGSALVSKTSAVDEPYLQNIVIKAKAFKDAVASFNSVSA